MSPSVPTTVAEEHEDLKRIVRDFETATGINIRGWARRPTPTAEYADADSLVCERCGLRQKGQHSDWVECLISYRELFAGQQMTIEQLKERIEQLKQAKAVPAGSERSTNRHVILNGERMCLSDAARKLHMSPKALRHRIGRRLGKNWEEIVETIDLAAIGIDQRYARRNDPGGMGNA